MQPPILDGQDTESSVCRFPSQAHLLFFASSLDGIVEKKRKFTILCIVGYMGIMQKENGNYYSMLGLYEPFSKLWVP